MDGKREETGMKEKISEYEAWKDKNVFSIEENGGNVLE